MVVESFLQGDESVDMLGWDVCLTWSVWVCGLGYICGTECVVSVTVEWRGVRRVSSAPAVRLLDY